MFSLRQAFHAGAAGFCGAGVAFALKTHQPEVAALNALLLLGNVVYAGWSKPAPQ
jgi:hypothetical protein